MLGTLDRKRLYDFLGAVMNRDSAVALSLLEDAYRSGIDLVRFASDSGADPPHAGHLGVQGRFKGNRSSSR